MSENATFTPSARKYERPKYNLTENLDALVARIDKLDKAGVAQWLEKYKWIIPWQDPSKNTFEMMALYQHAMNQLEWGEDVTVDGRFWRETHTNLIEVQKNLKITPADGLPGPKTTETLIKALTSSTALAVPVQAPASAPAPTPAAPASAPAAQSTPAPVAPVAKPASLPDVFPTGTISRHGLTITIPSTKPANTGGTGADEYKEWWNIDAKGLQWKWTRIYKDWTVFQGTFKNDEIASGIIFYMVWDSFDGSYTPEGKIKEGIYTFADGSKENGTFNAGIKLYTGSKFDKDGQKTADYKDGKEFVAAPAVVPATPASAPAVIVVPAPAPISPPAPPASAPVAPAGPGKQNPISA